MITKENLSAMVLIITVIMIIVVILSVTSPDGILPFQNKNSLNIELRKPID